MSKCADCGMRTAPGRRVCKTCSIEDRHGVPSDHHAGDAGDGVYCWVQDLSEDWHASMYFEDSRHVAACGEILDTPVADLKRDARFVDETRTCKACEAALEDEEEAVADGGEFERASEIRADGGRSPEDLVVLECEPCDYQTVVAYGAISMTSCPDCQCDLEVASRKIAHKCPETTVNSVTVDAGERCPFCQTVQKRPVVTDGGLEEVYRREVIVATDDGVAIGEAAVPKGGRDV